VLTCCCRVAIIARSCSSLVGGGGWRGWVPRMVPPVVAVAVAVTCHRAVVVVMVIVRGRMMIHTRIQFLGPGQT